MTTAFNTTFQSRLRAVTLVSALALSALFPAANSALADGGTVVGQDVPTVTPYEADTSNGLEGVTAIVDAATGQAPLLEDPAPDATVVTTLDNGTSVLLLIDSTDTVTTDTIRYWPVGVGGNTGWISGQDLSAPTDTQFVTPTAAAPTATIPPADLTCPPYDFTGDDTAEVATNGDGLVVRANPGTEAEELGAISDGTIVTLRIADLDTVYDAAGTRWWPIEADGLTGWVSGDFLVQPGTTRACDAPAPTTTPAPTSAPTSTPAVTPTPQDPTTAQPTPTSPFVTPAPTSQPAPAPTAAPTLPPTTTELANGSWAVIRTDDGAGVNLLTAPDADADASGFAPNQGLVQLLADPADGWVNVRWDRVDGYISTDLLEVYTPPATTTTTARQQSSSTRTTTLTVGGAATIRSESDAGVNVRTEARRDSDVIGTLQDGVSVNILNGPQTDDATDMTWYQVTDGTITGWVHDQLLAPTEAEPLPTEVPVTPVAQSQTPPAASAPAFIIPLDTYRFTQDFGCSNLGFYVYDPAFGCAVHDGVDLATTQGTPIKASAAGTVVASGWCDCGLGYYVEIDHGDGIHTVYGHMVAQPPVTVGQAVRQGETIGNVGSTGLSTGPHVHFMVRVNGEAQDPKNYLPPLK